MTNVLAHLLPTEPLHIQLINPSIRGSIISGLVRPIEFTAAGATPKSQALWELPDTGILFQRYLDSGKMINVYDWFESFQLVLETQHEHLKRADDDAQKGSPRKGKGKNRKRQDVNEDDEEKWKLQVQARFMRALHELDFLGFLKHTGRKAEHVLRTIFDTPEYFD